MVAPNATPLQRMLDPLADCLTLESAQRLLNYRIPSDVQAHIDQLADKANAGSLTDAESAEYRDFVEAIDLVAILQAKARQLVVSARP
jgi:hypothetical protein